MANYRDRRVAQEILKEVNQILRKSVRDPRVQDVTITDVRVTGDLQQATIYYSTLTDLASDKQKAQAGLEKATGLVRRELGKEGEREKGKERKGEGEKGKGRLSPCNCRA